MRNVIRPYWILGISSLILLMVGFFSNSNSAIDIQLHDTYFVIDLSHFYYACSFLILIIALLIKATDSARFDSPLRSIYIALSIMFLVGISYFGWLYNQSMGKIEERFIQHMESGYENQAPLEFDIEFQQQHLFTQVKLTLVILGFIIVQMLAIMVYIIRRKKRQSSDDTLLDN